MRGETVLFLPRGSGYRITDEHRQRTYGTIATETVAGGRNARRFILDIDLGGGMDMHEAFAELSHAQDRAEAYLRAQGALG